MYWSISELKCPRVDESQPSGSTFLFTISGHYGFMNINVGVAISEYNAQIETELFGKNAY